MTLALVTVAACQSEKPNANSQPSSSAGFITNGDVRLSYALDLPAGTGPFPAVVLVHGSGTVTKENMTWMARPFVEHGYAVLRYDKRGVGQSTGTYSNVGISNSNTMFALLASDAVAGVKFLRQQPSIDANRIGIAGASQAGWIIPVAATLAPEASFAVILVGPTTSVGIEIFYSSLAEGTSTPLSDVVRQLPGYTGPHGFDPLSTLRQLKIPTLWLYGADDRSIPTTLCVEIHETLRRELSPPFRVIVYPGLGHSLGPAIWPDIYAWLDANIGRGA